MNQVLHYQSVVLFILPKEVIYVLTYDFLLNFLGNDRTKSAVITDAEVDKIIEKAMEEVCE